MLLVTHGARGHTHRRCSGQEEALYFLQRNPQRCVSHQHTHAAEHHHAETKIAEEEAATEVAAAAEEDQPERKRQSDADSAHHPHIPRERKETSAPPSLPSAERVQEALQQYQELHARIVDPDDDSVAKRFLVLKSGHGMGNTMIEEVTALLMGLATSRAGNK